jgi:hypothetical protein
VARRRADAEGKRVLPQAHRRVIVDPAATVELGDHPPRG